ncbi:MAG TPA: FAD-linked oxidase C-terminal domain-containing protein [Acidobacteriaceae bacterium]|jgi:FAD/FMN-containing dehydrogenase/Fe-S oxidoreductase|nr:FAD-linked oxidase C-terminal domain-containing protein [Acidobacteriaceae bacterium]
MSAKAAPLISPEELTRPMAARRGGGKVDVDGLRRALEDAVEGEVRFDAGTKSMYAVDASNYRQIPIGVVIPKSKDDVVETVAACRQFGAPLLSRAGGTSLAGQTVNTAVVIDWSKYMHGVLEVNAQQRYARVLPGTVCDELRNRVLQLTGNLLNWGPDPATHSRCCFGGMIGNNSCGAHAQMAGKVEENVDELEILLYDGTRMTVGWMTDAEMERKIAQGGREGEIYGRLRRLRERYGRQIRDKYPPIPRRVSGYNLNDLVPGKDGRFNVARALVGSEGTLVTILEAKVRLIDARAERVILMLGYPDVYEAADHVLEIDAFDPVALEGIDDRLKQNMVKKGGPHTKFLPLLPEGGGWLMAEFGADRRQDALETAGAVMEKLGRQRGAPTMKLLTEKEDMVHMWELRESGLGATAFVPGEPDTWPGWEDSAVDPARLGDYLRGLRALYNKYEYNPALYGHFGQACVHCRVDFDLTSAAGIRKWRSFMEEATDLCRKYDGSWSGEHGDGQARAEFLVKMFGPELMEAFREYKSIWDPEWKMNPGKIVEPNRMDEDLRLGADYHPWEAKTHFQFPEDGGSFAHAAMRCVGIGLCRRKEAERADNDTMCPSFMVTHEEEHTTRGRAHHLWEMMHGGILEDRWRDESVKESLDLCLSCKGCKGDCPVNVDIATYKAEFLSHYWEGRMRPRYAFAFGWIDQWSRLASLWPGLVNLVTQTPGLSALAKAAAGMPQGRSIPEFAPETFRSWFRARGKKQPNGQNRGRVILWADTFNNYFFPETAQSAAEVLESAGFEVKVPMQHLCCGRPLYDYGFLDMAKGYLKKILRTLRKDIEAGVPVVVLEPSCATVFRDELHNLFPNDKLAKKLEEQTFVLSELLEKKAPDFKMPRMARKALVQGHCHHKSVIRFDDENKVMDKMGLDHKLLSSGCCGMAGSFGFEAEKYDISLRIGERALLPAVREAEESTVIMADGFSCRTQIAQETERQALHLAEVIRMAQEEGAGVRGVDVYGQPEAELVERRKATRRRARVEALVALGALGLAGLAIMRARHGRGSDAVVSEIAAD